MIVSIYSLNTIVGEFFDSLGITLIDFKVEFGRLGDAIVLADEITPDGSRLWEKGTNRKLDKDRFRRDLGDVAETYEELLERVETALDRS